MCVCVCVKVLLAEGLRNRSDISSRVPRDQIHLDKGRAALTRHCNSMWLLNRGSDGVICESVHGETAEQSSRHVIKILTFTTAHWTVEM